MILLKNCYILCIFIYLYAYLRHRCHLLMLSNILSNILINVLDVIKIIFYVMYLFTNFYKLIYHL